MLVVLCGRCVDRLNKLQSSERTCVEAREGCWHVAKWCARASVHRSRRSVSRISITKRKRWWGTEGRARVVRARGKKGRAADGWMRVASGRRSAVVGGGAGAARALRTPVRRARTPSRATTHAGCERRQRRLVTLRKPIPSLHFCDNN